MLRIILLLLLSTSFATAQPKGDSIIVNTPSSWIQRDISFMNNLELTSEYEVDTIAMQREISRLAITLTLMERDFYTQVHSLNLRTIYDIKMEVGAITRKVRKWQQRMRRWNDELAGKTLQIEKITGEIKYFSDHGDSLLKQSYADELTYLQWRHDRAIGNVSRILKVYTAAEDSLNIFSGRAYDLYDDADEALTRREMYLLHRDLPPIWKATQADYTASFTATVKTSFLQTLENLRFYAESSLSRIVLFRILIFLLCLVPLRMFKKKKDDRLMFLSKYPSLSSTIMGMVLAPFIFIDAPHAFLEMIFISLTALVGYLTWKEHPYLNKKAFFILILSFLLLMLLNFFVTVTFVGRIIFSLSIFLLIPLWIFYKEIPGYPIKRKKAMRAFILVIAAHIAMGWILTITGNYTLGKALILVAFDTVILSMMFYIAIHSLLDYILILTDLFNERNENIRINADLVYAHLRPLFIFISVVLILIGYLINTNLYEILIIEFRDFFTQPRTIGDGQFTFGSVAIFLGSVFLAFYIAGILRNMVGAREDSKEHRKSNIGSYLLLGRFLLICAGFFVGVVASGVSLSNFTIILGAIGVGIGFGLQNIASNLLSGIIIVFEKPFVVGDRLEIANELGRVKEIGLRATRLSIIDGSEILIPNGKLLANDLKNWTLTNNLRRLELQIPTDQEVDHAQVIGLMQQALAEIPEVIKTSPNYAVVSGVVEDMLMFTLHFWVEDSENRIVMKGKVLGRIHELFKEHKISYPRRDVWINPES
ncbi:mechanosensitive ion channel [Chitinophaga sp. SYP-B3965]|uniref:mechanosensitive ion channel family protein n=1 Tax=Chitinophaga sp. SYP-B3965 TaxID=2663120 RepID=UPI0012999CEB|nr:mechanosensitive ion channel domain-containing protein [Chitinophaga sp. SYP-B3965]MRG44441.1 mechanosensitive ion channel [Chitinophaga sp. SYP-B3965]